MEAIIDIAKKNNLFVIEDACQSIGADYIFKDGSIKSQAQLVISVAHLFSPPKILGCYGDGGAIFTNDDKLAEKLRSSGNHGMKVRYYHDEIGVNSRLDSIQASILRVKLRQA